MALPYSPLANYSPNASYVPVSNTPTNQNQTTTNTAALAKPIVSPIAPSTPTTKPAPAVISTAPAISAVGKMKTTLATQNTGLQNQAVNNAQDKLASDQAAQLKAQTDQNNQLMGMFNADGSMKTGTSPAGPPPASSSSNPPPAPFTPGASGYTSPNQNSATVVRSQDNGDGTSTNFLSDGSTSTVRLSKNADGTYSATEVGANQGGAQGGVNGLYNQVLNNQQQSDQAYQKFSDTLDQIKNGTFPLTPAQQSQINSTKMLAEQARSAAQLSSKAAEGRTLEANARIGLDLGSPTQAIGRLQQTINNGLTEIAKLDALSAKSLADLQSSFDTNNLTLAKDSYDAFQKAMKDKNDTITSIATATQNHLDKVIEQGQKQQEIDNQTKAENFKEVMDNKNFTLDEKKEAFNQYIQQANLTEKQKVDAVDMWAKKQEVAIKWAGQTLSDSSSAQSWVTNIKNGTAKISDVPKNLKDAVSIGLANSGGNKEADLLSTTQKSLSELQDMVDKNTGFNAAVGAKGLSSFFGLKGTPLAGSKAANFDAKLNQVKNDVILPNLNLLHGLGRVTDREFQALTSAITALSTNLSEDQFKVELKDVTDSIDKKVNEANSGGPTEHSGITLPTFSQAPTSTGSIYNGVTLPN